MTLEEQIEIMKGWAEKARTQMAFSVLFEKDIAQLLEWLEDYKQLKADYIELDKQLRAVNTENEELKRLMRSALESFDFISDNLIPYTESVCVCDFAMLRANPYDNCFNCPLSNAKHKYCKWRYYDEAMKLLGGTENAEN